jgi:hypothetical protein
VAGASSRQLRVEWGHEVAQLCREVVLNPGPLAPRVTGALRESGSWSGRRTITATDATISPSSGKSAPSNGTTET